MSSLKFFIPLFVFQVAVGLEFSTKTIFIRNGWFTFDVTKPLNKYSHLSSLRENERDSVFPSSEQYEYNKIIFEAEKDVSFYLVTRNSLYKRERLQFNNSESLRLSHFNAIQPTRIIIHGWLGSKYSRVFSSLTSAYLRNGCYNIILVDWGKGAIVSYNTASSHVKSVGIVVAKFVDSLHQIAGVNFENIQLIGFSMGAHIAGIAGKYMQQGRIPVIFGLDPALPLFDLRKNSERLSKHDAIYVEIIHTNSGKYGYDEPIGHADFYVNYGNYQPGCILAECNHFRSIKIFAESLNSRIGFWSRGCDDKFVFNLLINRKCNRPTEVYALLGGGFNKKTKEGIYFLTTNSKPPYARGYE